MAAVLVTLTQAKSHLYITTPPGDPGDAAIQLKLDQAEAIILHFLKGANGLAVGWTDPTNAPPSVTAAILLMLGRLHEERGDHEQSDEDLWTRINHLLVAYRDPALA